jgi:hypothetical protein
MDRAPDSAAPLGDVIFVICEFQIVDRDTETHNELGEASHAKYKERQKKAVMRRLQLGGVGELPQTGGTGDGIASGTNDALARAPMASDVRRKK